MSHRSRRVQKFAVLSGSALVAAPLFGTGAADAATLQVTNLNDSGAGSLRDAIETADGDVAADTITFAPGLNGTISLTTGRLEVNTPMTIVGPGASAITVDGGASTGVLYLYSATTAAVTISDLTITNGATSYGAGVYLGGNVDLTLDGVEVSDNEASSYGGGIYFTDASSLTVVDSEISGNSATYGGGIFQESFYNGALVIRGSKVSNNYALYRSGGLYFNDAPSLLIEDSEFIGNSTGSGGGGAAEINVIEGATATIVDSTFSGNAAGGSNGGALYFESPVKGDVSITGSTFSGNSATTHGGGIYFGGVYDVDVTIENSTFSGNTALYGGGIYVLGFYSTRTDFEISHSTITQNSATGTDSGANGNNGGGGIYLNNSGWSDPGVIVLDHTVVSGNTSPIPGDDIAHYSGGFEGKWAMIGNLDGFTLDGANNLAEGDAKLGPLADNGGTTLTHLPLAGSPLINAGDPAHGASPATDQRGFARIGAGRIDVGAVESDAPVPEIPATGSSNGTLAALGAALLAMGGALRLVDRRRTRQL